MVPPSRGTALAVPPNVSLGDEMADRVGGPFAGLIMWVRPAPGVAGAGQPGVRVAREQYHRTLFLVIGFWALATCVAAAFSPIAAFGVAVLGIAHIVTGYAVERRRRASIGPRRP